MKFLEPILTGSIIWVPVQFRFQVKGFWYRLRFYLYFREPVLEPVNFGSVPVPEENIKLCRSVEFFFKNFIFKTSYMCSKK
jgi:hypothetical protein